MSLVRLLPGRVASGLGPAVLAVALLAPCYADIYGAKAKDERGAPSPRTSVPSAHLLPKDGSAAQYVWRGADFGGRRMRDHQYGIQAAITPRLELGWDRHKIHVRGRNAGNTFDSRTTGWQLRYGLRPDLAVFFQLRDSDARVVRGDAVRIPPDATAITIGGVCSRPLGERGELHLAASGSRLEVGDEDTMSWMAGAGMDYSLGGGLEAQGSLGLFTETGGASGTELALSGGLHYEDRTGFFADVTGTLLPSGAPLSGDPLSDASVFVLDPVFANEAIVQDFQDSSVGFYTVRVGYSTHF